MLALKKLYASCNGLLAMPHVRNVHTTVQQVKVCWVFNLGHFDATDCLVFHWVNHVWTGK